MITWSVLTWYPNAAEPYNWICTGTVRDCSSWRRTGTLAGRKVSTRMFESVHEAWTGTS